MKPFTPHILPPKNIDWERLVSLIGSANGALARYDGILQYIPNTEILFSPLTTQEAVLSSKIEGTQATLEDVFSFQASREPANPKSEDIGEVINYRKTLEHAVDRIGKDGFPLSLRLIKEMHEILLDNVRGQNKDRGNFRRIQNWIGAPGSTIETARYVPPAPFDVMPALDTFEKYIHFDEKDRLVQLAILHAQFEIIHPFLDGNGRIGRLLIPLFLFDKKVLSKPLFYISAYFESNREEYYNRLLSVSQTRDWNNWIEYFLNAVLLQANKNIQYANSILSLYNEMKIRVVELTKSKHSIKTIDFIFRKPIFTTSNFIEETDIPRPGAKRILSELAGEVLTVIVPGQGSKPAKYSFNRLLEITKA